MLAEALMTYLVRWLWDRARPAGRRVNAEVDRALEVGMDRLYRSVAARLGRHSALPRLESDIHFGRDSSAASRRVGQELDAALARDPAFHDEMSHLLRDLRRLDVQAGRDAAIATDHARSTIAQDSTIISDEARVLSGSGQIGHRFGAFGAIAVVLIGALVFAYYQYAHRDADPEVVAYQKRVVATCEQVAAILNADHSGEVFVLDPARVDHSNPASMARIRKAALMKVLAAHETETRAAFDQLGQAAVPRELASRKSAVDRAYHDWEVRHKAAIAVVDEKVWNDMTLAQLLELAVPIRSDRVRADVNGAELNGALSDLAGQQCIAI